MCEVAQSGVHCAEGPGADLVWVCHVSGPFIVSAQRLVTTQGQEDQKIQGSAVEK